MTTNEAALFAGCTRQSISRHCKRGTLRATKARGRDWWIEQADLKRWLAAPKNKGGRPRKDNRNV